ncbi:MAG TPA: GHKL domain-containing protein [Desulfobacteraceae bacterium]|nr:GHKL domain-containing protein [Desulfobacteraceae bacterium]
MFGRRTAIQVDLYKNDLQALRNQVFHDHKLVSVGQLAGGVAHEINNPLAIIASETGLIKDMLNPDTELEYSPEAIIKELDEIEKATYRAKSITGKILSFVKKREPETMPCNVEQLLEDVIGGFVEQEFKVSNITVQRDFSKDIPLLMLDPDMMRQVFLNLINNAGDAVSEGGTITLKTSIQDDYLKITISDTGPGIGEDEIDKLFLPFYTTKKAGSGTGLGLSISLKIIEEFGGTIEVNSSKGKGSDFIIFLPISKLNTQ